MNPSPVTTPAVAPTGRPAARWLKPAVAAGMLAYFCYCSRDVPAVRFAPDDLMNLDYYWRLGPLRLLLLFLEPWRGGYRPMGGLFYGPLLHWFGLNPEPYHLVMLALMLGIAWLLYRFARVLGSSETVAGLAALAACYHAGLSLLYYNTSFIYDVLCCFFYLAAIVYYIGIRRGGRSLDFRQTTVVLALHFCALNSKEMAVTLPLVLVAYEWIYHGWRIGRAPVLTALLNLPLLHALFLRPDALVNNAEYRPAFSLARVLAFHATAFSDLFETWHFFTLPWILATWALLTFLAWRGKNPVLRFCWAFFLITPLPLEVLVGRGGACLAIPFCGIAIFAATLVVGAAEGLAKLPRTADGRRAVFVSTVAAAALLWTLQNVRVKRAEVEPQMRALGQETWAVIRQFHTLHPKVSAHSTVIFLNDPFEDYDMAFIAELWFRQPDLNIRLQRKTPLPPAELAKSDHLFDYEQGKLIQLR